MPIQTDGEIRASTPDIAIKKENMMIMMISVKKATSM